MKIDVQTLADRHGFSSAAVQTAVDALQTGGGGMAQFNHPELGGHGQWMPTMLMIGQMSDHQLKARVDALFQDLHASAESTPKVSAEASRGEPSRGTRPSRPNDSSFRYDASSGNRENWYPADLGKPTTTGAQNDFRYAYFPDTRRLAIEHAGKLTTYDTGDHRISGVSQSQANNAGDITFTSQSGPIKLSSLKTVGG